jgi:hypothetical protein
LHRPIASDRPRQLGRPNRLQKYATGVHAHKWWRTCSCARSLLVRERCVCPDKFRDGLTDGCAACCSGCPDPIKVNCSAQSQRQGNRCLSCTV